MKRIPIIAALLLIAPAALAQPATVQASLKTLAAKLNPVHFCRNSSVFGRVVSPTSIEMQGFICFRDAARGGTPAIGTHDIAFGACPLASSTTSYKLKCKFDVAMNVKFADPADTHLMVPGKLVRLGGDFRTWKEDKLDYVTVANAKVLFTDYYWIGGVSSLPLPMGPYLGSYPGPMADPGPAMIGGAVFNGR